MLHPVSIAELIRVRMRPQSRPSASRRTPAPTKALHAN